MDIAYSVSLVRRIIGIIMLVLCVLLVAEVVIVMLHKINAVVLISSNYHMDRAVQTAKSASFSNILRAPAPSSFLSYAANVLYELVLEVNELTLHR